MNFREKLDFLLDLYGITAYQLAKSAGISEAAISRWRDGTSRPSLSSYQQLASHFGVSVNYLKNDSVSTPFSRHFDSLMRQYNLSNKKIGKYLGAAQSEILSFRSGNLEPNDEQYEKLKGLFVLSDNEFLTSDADTYLGFADIDTYEYNEAERRRKLADFVMDDDDFLSSPPSNTEQESQLLEMFKKLPDAKKQEVINFVAFTLNN